MEIITKKEERKKYLVIARIVKSHGLDGKMRLKSYSDNILDYEKLYIKVNGIYKKIDIEFGEQTSNNYIIKVPEIDNVDDTYMYVNKEIYILREDLQDIDDQYYITDIIGIKAYDENKNYLGEITDILTTGMQDTFVIKMDSKGEIAIPNLEEYIIKIDVDKKEAHFNIAKLRGVFGI